MWISPRLGARRHRGRQPLTEWSIMPRRALTITSLFAATAFVLTACSPGTPAGETKTLKVVYQKTDSFTALDTLFQSAKKEFEAANQGVTVTLEPIQANDDDYGTKLALALRSPSTAPDVFYEDTFKVRSDVDAGYLLKLDSHLAGWKDWDTFDEGAKAAGLGDDGGTYAVPLGTDTRGIWYNKKVLTAAGVSVPWEPRTWQDILDTARKIKASDPTVVPFNMYAGKASGEGTVMQSFYELLYGTGSELYDADAKKWVVGSQGFTDSLAFLKTLYDEKLAVSPAEALDANVWKKVFGEWLPQGKMGAVVEGSYTPSFWQKGGSYEWAGYGQDMGVTAFPTQKGQAPGGVSMSGGWTLAVGAETKNADLAFDFPGHVPEPEELPGLQHRQLPDRRAQGRRLRCRLPGGQPVCEGRLRTCGRHALPAGHGRLPADLGSGAGGHRSSDHGGEVTGTGGCRL